MPALLLRAALFLLAVGVCADGAWAQMGHPTMSRPRALHERLDAADRVVRVRIGTVSEGRIGVEQARALVGEVEPVFEIKRSPLRPHPLATGDEAILFLRGARAPYVLVDEPGEVIRILDAGQERRWSEAITALAGSRSETSALAATYLDWVDQGPASLRDLGANGVFGLIEQDPELQERLARSRAEPAADAATPAEARRISAGIAASTPAGASALCAALTASETPLDAGVTEIALRACGAAGTPEAVDLLESAAAHEAPAVRMAAARSLALVARGAPEAALEVARELAENDPDNAVRRAAERMLRAATRELPPKRRSHAEAD